MRTLACIKHGAKIMIDFIKAELTGIELLSLLHNPKLNFCREVNTETGELRKTNRHNKEALASQNAFYRSLEFEVFDSGTVYLSGSLHKFWNHGGHNFNDFGTDGIREALAELARDFSITPPQMKIRQLELGVNIIPPYPTKEILPYCFLHGTNPFVWIRNNDEGKYIQSVHSQYIIKIYDKARDAISKGFEVPTPEIMRFEIKFLKLERLKKYDIFTVADLLQYGLDKFVPELAEEWQKVLFYDFTIQSNRPALLNYKNPLYWQDLKARRSAFYKHKNKLAELTAKHSSNVAKQIENCIRDKGNFLSRGGAQIDPKPTDPNGTIIENEKQGVGAQIDHLYIPSIRTPQHEPNQKVCIITGINISMQKDESLMLSHTGLKHYFKTDKKVFNELIRRYCPAEFIQSEYVLLIEKTAHAIRCKKTNREIKQKRMYPDNQFRLFAI